MSGHLQSLKIIYNYFFFGTYGTDGEAKTPLILKVNPNLKIVHIPNKESIAAAWPGIN